MRKVALLGEQSNLTYLELREAARGADEPTAWGRLPAAGDEYLHTDGSIHGIVLHAATSKVMYASQAFRDLEVRWRDLADRLDGFEPNWAAALDYLDEAHEYWRAAWENLADDDLEQDVPHFSGRLWPAWKIIATIVGHDAYHAGQVALLRYAVSPATSPPDSVAEDIRTHCSSLPGW
ncbi:MAG TPA: DinB family protein [Fimbriimonadaceae bacterium]|nr:DinB family protein [Fimbriimonadaceae bacterium]HRJ95147.1 DinB family protein [Fimbriimonadaceae bacterium]